MSRKHMVAYVITKNGPKSYWNRIGVGFINRDGSINVKLDALPVSGEFQLREYSPPEWDERERSPARVVGTPPPDANDAGKDDDIPF